MALTRDLETIVFALELGAIYLTDGPESTFTTDELFAKAREAVGDEISLDEGDMRIVLKNSRFLKKAGGGRLCLR